MKYEVTIFEKVRPKPKNKGIEARKAKIGTRLLIENKDFFFNLIKNYAWSPSLFTDNERLNKNFEKCGLLALDIDEGLTLEEAMVRISELGYTAIVGTSVNHTENNHRFRIIFPLSKYIETKDSFRATWAALKELFPEADNLPDPARFYFACKDVYLDVGWRKFNPLTGVPKECTKPKLEPNEGELGEPSLRTKKFLEEGAPKGLRHREIVLAICDFKAQKFTKDHIMDAFSYICGLYNCYDHVKKQVENIFDSSEIRFDFRRKK